MWHPIKAHGGIEMIRKLFMVSALFATASAGSLAQAQQSVPVPATAEAPEVLQIEGVAAIVNDELITYTDVRQRARMLLLSLGGQQPTAEQVQQITSQALEQLIDEKLQLQKAAEYDVEVSDSDIAASIDQIAAQSNINREQLYSSLLQSGVNPASLEDQSRADIAWRRIMGGLYGSRIRISENQIDGQLKRMKASASQEQYQLGEIFLYAPTSADKEQATTAASSIREQLEAGAPFELAAQRFSSAPTAATGGDMGWINLSDLDPARAQVIKAMPGPGLTQPIIADDGVYLMAVINKREPSESVTVVDLTRLTVVDGQEASLNQAISSAEGCEAVQSLAANDDNLDAAVLSGLNVDDLGPEGKSMVMATEVGQPTDVFAMSGTIGVMYVCARDDNADGMPSRDQIENRLYSEQLGMISQRSLRNARREATIIRR